MAWGYSEIAYCQIWDLESCHVTLKLIKMTAQTASQENITIMAYESRKREGKLPTTMRILYREKKVAIFF